MSPPTRRQVVRTGGPTLMITLAGCSSLAGTPAERGPEFDTPPPGECEAVDRPMSGPTKGGLEPVAYPDYPDEVTADTAREFEYAYRRNEFIQNNEDTEYDELSVDVREEINGYPDEETVVERDEGYVVTVIGEMQYGVADRPETATGTERPSGGGPFTPWFYLADRYAIRDANPSAEEPNFEYGEVVVCDE